MKQLFFFLTMLLYGLFLFAQGKIPAKDRITSMAMYFKGR